MDDRRGFLKVVAGVATLTALPPAIKAVFDGQAIDYRDNLAKAVANPRKEWHLGYSAVSCEMFGSLLPEGTHLTTTSGVGDEDHQWLHDALLLPADAVILAVSPHYLFRTRKLALIIEHPSFPVHIEGMCIEQIDPVYRVAADGKPEFAGWSS